VERAAKPIAWCQHEAPCSQISPSAAEGHMGWRISGLGRAQRWASLRAQPILVRATR